MTSRKKQQLKNRIIESRGRLLSTYPFFAILLMYVDFVAVTDIKKMSINENSIFFNYVYIDKLKDSELDYMLCHLLMHLICGDIWENDFAYEETYHLACDIIVNNSLLGMGFKDKYFTHLGYLYSYIPGVTYSIDGYDAESIYYKFLYKVENLDEYSKNKLLPDSHKYWKFNKNNEESGEIILKAEYDVFFKDLEMKDEKEENKKGKELSKNSKEIEEGNKNDKSNNDKIKKVWAKIITQAVNNANVGDSENTFGIVPLLLQRQLDDNKTSKIDWKKLLNNFLQENIYDYTFSPPDKRYIESDFFLPDFNPTEYSIKDVILMIDTSGSIDIKNLSKFYAEISGVIEQFNGNFTGKLGFFDCEVKGKLQDFCSKGELKNIIPLGGGGTNFFCIFEYIKENYNSNSPCCIIIFTDGYGEFPNKNELSIPILWVINNEEITPPFGKTIRILD